MAVEGFLPVVKSGMLTRRLDVSEQFFLPSHVRLERKLYLTHSLTEQMIECV
jgi:hypothetical protein